MTNMTFYYFIDYENGKIARMETIGDYEIPLNVLIENEHNLINMSQGQYKLILYAISDNLKFYSSTEAFNASSCNVACNSVFPIGVFSENPNNQNVKESPHILFAGKVMCVEKDAGNSECCIYVKTGYFGFYLYASFEDDIRAGYIVYGKAYLYADIIDRIT